jgi:3-deoxy-D-manno-octulosonic-acid transferase
MIAGRDTSIVQLKTKHSVIWFHCASVGEFEQGLPLMNKLKYHWNEVELVTTFFSPSGYDYATKNFPDETFLYLPFDSKFAMKEFVTQLNPTLVVFIKYEFWFNLLQILQQRKISTYLVSGIFRSNQFFFKSYGSFFAKRLNAFTYFFLQDEASIKLLNSIGYTNAVVVGDTRYDRVVENAIQDFTNDKINSFIANTKNVFIAGSIWQADMEVVNNIISKLPPDWKVIIVPHELNHFKQEWILARSAYYSGQQTLHERIMIVDTMGILSKLYRYAKFAYVGGGFGSGIHNILEPAVYKIPVLIGPNWGKFNEAHQLIQLGVVFDVTAIDFEEKVFKMIVAKEDFSSEISSRLSAVFNRDSNVVDKIFVIMNKLEQSNLKTFFNN